MTQKCKDFHYSFTGLMLQWLFALFLLLTQSKGVPHLLAHKSVNGSFVLPSVLKGKWLALVWGHPIPSCPVQNSCTSSFCSVCFREKLTRAVFVVVARLLPPHPFLQRASALLQNRQTSTSQPFICSSVCASNKGPNFGLANFVSLWLNNSCFHIAWFF